jgi:hypothetical protein
VTTVSTISPGAGWSLLGLLGSPDGASLVFLGEVAAGVHEAQVGPVERFAAFDDGVDVVDGWAHGVAAGECLVDGLVAAAAVGVGVEDPGA